MSDQLTPGSGKGSGGSSKTGFKIPKELGTMLAVGKRLRDVYQVACSVHKDYKENTTHNTVGTLVRLGASQAGSSAGGTIGAAVGSLLGPLGATVGCVLGSYIGGYVFKQEAIYVFDSYRMIHEDFNFQIYLEMQKFLDKCND